MNTREVVKHLANAFHVREDEIGYAGLKDRRATTTQTFSVNAKSEAPLAQIEGDRLRVLGVTRHRNKLKVGHLAGNRFRARLAGGAEHEAEARAILDELVRRGLPNYFGDQRFGQERQNAALGREVLQKGPRAAGPPWKAKFAVSALQSELFNAVLDRRLDAAALDAALVGDVLQKTESHGLFVCEDAALDAPRVASYEVSATGPIPGPSMRLPTAGTVPSIWETEVLADAGLTIADFTKVRAIAEGTRRAVRARVTEPAVTVEGPDLWVTFALPAGAYATVLIEELIGAPPSDGPQGIAALNLAEGYPSVG